MGTPVTQLIQEVRGDIHEYAQTVFRTLDLLTWINEGLQAVVTETYARMQDWLTRRMISTDATEVIQLQTYDPSELTITGGESVYTLPPNVLHIRRITAVDSCAVFLPHSLSHPDFVLAASAEATSDQSVYYYTLIGANSLVISPTPAVGVSIDIELWYVAMPDRLTMSSTITALPIQAMKAIKAYAVWQAFQSVDSPDVNAKWNVYQHMIKECNTLMALRVVNEPVFVEGAFDVEDQSDLC